MFKWKAYSRDAGGRRETDLAEAGHPNQAKIQSGKKGNSDQFTASVLLLFIFAR